MRRTFTSALVFVGSFAALLTAADAATIRSRSGATAQVGGQHAGQFQSYVNDLEARGSRVLFMGGYRRGHCSSGHQHPCGSALDVCQTSRGRVDPRCHLPPPRELAAIAARHGLFEGSLWCSSDYGHAQAGASAACGDSWAFAARRHHHRQRFAHAHRHHRLARHHRRYARG